MRSRNFFIAGKAFIRMQHAINNNRLKYSAVFFIFLLAGCFPGIEPQKKDSTGNDSASVNKVIAIDSPSAEDPENKIGFSLMSTEMIGKLKLGTPGEKTIALLGKPTSTSRAEEWS